jgi:hypothetical protein
MNHERDTTLQICDHCEIRCVEPRWSAMTLLEPLAGITRILLAAHGEFMMTSERRPTIFHMNIDLTGDIKGSDSRCTNSTMPCITAIKVQDIPCERGYLSLGTI